MKTEFFRDSGGFYKIELRQTADAHSRQVWVDGEQIGLLLFHDWTFLFEPTVPRFKLRIMPRLMGAINDDSAIAWQKLEDERYLMARNARASLTEAGINHSAMNDQEAVAEYFNLSK